jgi:hypothetical protein
MRNEQTQILIGLFICHWLADYTPLSNTWMLNAKRFGKPIFPIFIHAAMHAMLMSLVLGWFIGFTNHWSYLVIFQWGTHFLIDVWKGRMNKWFPILQSPANKYHWIIFGFDQLLHYLVILTMSLYATI